MIKVRNKNTIKINMLLDCVRRKNGLMVVCTVYSCRRVQVLGKNDMNSSYD